MIGVFYDNFTQAAMKYKTLPKERFSDEFVIISGGDVGSTKPAQEMTKNLSPLKPRAIFIGFKKKTLNINLFFSFINKNKSNFLLIMIFIIFVLIQNNIYFFVFLYK